MVYVGMENVLKQLIDGNLSAEVIKEQLADGKLQHYPDNDLGHLSFKSTEFIPYFLNYLRDESSCHFASDLPIISPKKIKKKKRLPKRRTPTSDTSNDSSKSSARGSLFSSPPPGKVGNATLSPVQQVQASKVKETPNRIGSPVVNQHSGNSSGGTETGRLLHVSSTPIKFNLDEDFPPVSSQSTRKSSTPTRRITPTPARTRTNSSNLFNSFTFETDSLEYERSFSAEKLKQRHKHGSSSASPKNARKASAKLKLEDFMQQGSRNRTPSRYARENVDYLNSSNDMDRSSSCVNVSESSSFNTCTDERVLPRRELVTEPEGLVLQNLAEIHSFCILENLVPNIVVEMCFVLQLLTVEGKTDQENDHGVLGYFKTIHNCVYYAVLVLEKLSRIIKLLDKGTLRLLLDNARIMEFSSGLAEELRKIYPTISVNKVPYSLVKSPLNSVPFQASIDNRNNFSTDQAFHCFKRQRDTFYEIVREWEEQHGKPGWSLEEKLGDKIRYVVHQKPGLANHAHFARLFQSQLIQMCCYENILPTFNEGESPEFVGNLFRSNPEKLFRLQQRLVAPLSTTAGPCPSPGFTETEEFFREFIVAAMSPSFNRYLMDTFIVKIIELNSITSDEGLDTSTEDEAKDDQSSKLQVKFASSLITLRTLAKFLGFLVFSPYHNSADLPIVVKDTLISARNQVSQQIDVMFYLKKAVEEQRLVLTLPWVIEYLSMMDSVCPFLDYYIEVFDLLHHIYRTTLPQSSSVHVSRNGLMLSAGLGWLFEMPVIPDTMFVKSSEKISCDSKQTNSCSALDKMELVDQHLLYTCCPYLGELRSILAEAVVGKANKRGYMKKIKPICADNVEASPSSCPLLQTQLEDNFFRNQPEFLKKDVDFITTRIYLNMVNMVKNFIIPSELKQAKLTLVTESTFDIRNWREVNKEEFKANFLNDLSKAVGSYFFKEKNKVLIMKLSNKTADGVLARISSDINKECKSRCFIAVQSLTPQDMNDIVIKTAAGIVHQSAMNKLMEWSHQNISAIIEKLVRNDMDKMITREQNLPVNTYRIHAEDTDHPFNWFYKQLLNNSQESEGNKTQTHVEQSTATEQNNSVQKKTELEDTDTK